MSERDGRDAARDSYRADTDSALWDLIEHAYQQGALTIDEPWQHSVWGAMAELARRHRDDSDDSTWLRQRLDAAHQLLEAARPLLNSQLRDALDEELTAAERPPGVARQFRRVRPAGYQPH